MRSNKIRKLIIESAYHAKHGHIPSAFSIVEIICALDQITNSAQDVFVLSKGHGCLAYYAYLADKNIITLADLHNFGKRDSKLGGHPDKNKVPGMFASTGSLGQGLPMATGAAMAMKILDKPGKVYCIIGDGECNEGSIWESLQIAAHQQLNNLVCVVDDNVSQNRSLPSKNLYNKFLSFGWDAMEVDGHSINEMVSKFKTNSSYKPVAFIAKTVKGKGLKDLEDNTLAWHHRAPNHEEYNQFVKELNEKDLC